jgi:hypothetical protein
VTFCCLIKDCGKPTDRDDDVENVNGCASEILPLDEGCSSSTDAVKAAEEGQLTEDVEKKDEARKNHVTLDEMTVNNISDSPSGIFK